MTNETGKNPKAAKRIGKAQNSNPTRLGTAQTSLDRPAIGRNKTLKNKKLNAFHEKIQKQPGESANHNTPIQLSSAQHKLHGICWQLDGWNPLDPQEGEGAGSWRYWHFSPWTHPVGILWNMEDARCFGLLLCCHCFSLSLGYLLGRSSIQTTERWQQAHWWACRAAIPLASWTSTSF